MTPLNINSILHDSLRTDRNNFDLIRLVAATQVALTHSINYLGVGTEALVVLRHFPGVPIFFFISGFLIYRSYQNINQNRLAVFAVNRALRLYPGLVLCCIVSLIMLFASGYLDVHTIDLTAIAKWIAAHLSILQFYNPPFLGNFGTGAINGSLWTISVELQFYLMTPIVYRIFKAGKAPTAAFLLVFLLANHWNTYLNQGSTLIEQLAQYSFVPWFVMFLVGSYVAANGRIQHFILGIHPLLLLVGYLVVSIVSEHFGAGTGNNINPVSYILLAALTYSLAFRGSDCAWNLIGRNDISYGVYIFHMPIVNLFVHIGLDSKIQYLVLVMASVFAISYFSWKLVEKPMLSYKRATLRRFE